MRRPSIVLGRAELYSLKDSECCLVMRNVSRYDNPAAGCPWGTVGEVFWVQEAFKLVWVEGCSTPTLRLTYSTHTKGGIPETSLRLPPQPMFTIPPLHPAQGGWYSGLSMQKWQSRFSVTLTRSALIVDQWHLLYTVNPKE